MLPRIYNQKVPSQLAEGESICTHSDPEQDINFEVVQAIKDITDDLYSTLVDINKDENIPINRQANKQSKGDHAAIAQEKAKEQIKGMIQGTGWVSGKWIWRMDKDQGQDHYQDRDQDQDRDRGPDNTWRQLLPAVLDGPLSKAGVVAAKVKLERDQYLFCLFVPDAFSTATCTSTLEALISIYGIVPAGVKTDAFTCAGIDSRHASGIDTLIFRPRDMPGGLAKVKRLKAEYDQHEAIFGTDISPADLGGLLLDPSEGLDAFDDEEPISNPANARRGIDSKTQSHHNSESDSNIITPPQGAPPAALTGASQCQAPEAHRKRKLPVAGADTDTTEITADVSPLKLMRHLQYDILKPQPYSPTTPRRMPLIQYDTGFSSLSCSTGRSPILQTPDSGVIFGTSLDSPSTSNTGVKKPLIKLGRPVIAPAYSYGSDAFKLQSAGISKPLIQLRTSTTTASADQANSAVSQAFDAAGVSGIAPESRLAKRSRMMRL